MKNNIILLLLILLACIIVSCSSDSAGDGIDVWSIDDPAKWTSNGKWTVMVWLDGDNNLESAAMMDLNEMELGLYNAFQGNPSINNDLSIIVQADRISGYDSSGYGSEDWTNTRRYRIKPDSITSDLNIRSLHLANMEETNMGDAANLKNFIKYCKENYPADNYALILWNHGGGVRSTSSNTFISKSLTKSSLPETESPQKAICWDDTDGEDCLYIGEITDTLTDSEDVDFLGFDACLMGMAEIAYEYRPESGKFGADFMAASAATEQGDGWEYDRIFNRFSGSGTDSEGDVCESVTAIDGSDFAQIVVKEYEDAFSGYPGESMAAYDLSQISSVKTALDTLAAALTGELTDTENLRGSFSSTLVLEYFDETYESEWISNPHFDLYDFAYKVNASSSFTADARTKAGVLQTAVESCVISSWGDSYTGHTSGQNGLGFFFPDGNRILAYVDEEPITHYYTQWWYTAAYTNSWWTGGHYYGNLDFCNSNSNATVEGWRELLEYWYDNGPLYYTPSTY